VQCLSGCTAIPIGKNRKIVFVYNFCERGAFHAAIREQWQMQRGGMDNLFARFLKWRFEMAARHGVLLRRAIGVAAFCLLADGIAAASAADSLVLNLPLDCRPGVDCWVANYLDLKMAVQARAIQTKG